MRIGFFTDSYSPVKHGVQASVDSFAENLERLGHEVYIYTTHSPGYKDIRSRVIRLKAIKVIKNPEMRLALPFVHDGALVEMVKNKLDIVHAHTPFGIGLLGKFISKFHDAPVVYTHHTDYAEYAKFYIGEKLVFPHITKKYTTWFSNTSDAVIAPSEKIRHMLTDYKVKKPIFIIPTGINPNLFDFSETHKAEIPLLRKKLGITGNEKVILSLGRLGKEKNVDFILKSFAENERLRKTAKCIIAGSGGGEESLKKLADKLGIADRVIFTGFVPENEKNIYYRMADVFVFASKTDTQGIVILEAMMNGVPVVALKDEAFQGMLIPDKTGYVVASESLSTFSKKIVEVIFNPALIKRFGLASRKIAETFSETEQTKKLLQVYESLLRKKTNDSHSS